MPSFAIISADPFRTPQQYAQQLTAPYLVLIARGFVRHLTRLPDGQQILWHNPGPRFIINLPGSTVEFESGADRENWAVQLRTDDFRYGRTPQEIGLRDGGEWFTVPQFAEVPADRLAYWKEKFERLCRTWDGGLPGDRLWARLTIAEAFSFMIEQGHAAAPPYPVTQLKRLIDDDTGHDRAIDELYAACNYSSSRLRELFQQTYHVSPRDYRNQRRMARVMELVTRSRMTVKEIARATGFKHVSHISAAFRKARGVTLTEAIRRYRR